MSLTTLFTLLFVWHYAYTTSEPNPPYWPSSVYVFNPANSGNTQTVVDRVFAQNGGTSPAFNGQWSTSRYAFLFMPGNHNVDIDVGFYTSVIGLGVSPSNTIINTIRVQNGDNDYTGGALDNFWRSVENFQTGYTLWAVSQACPMRRVIVKGNLDLYQYNGGCCAGYASGGYLADSQVTGTINSGSQQQYFTRNSFMSAWDGGVWNMVFVGNTGSVPNTHCSNDGGNPYTTVHATPVIAEKPYIVYNPDSTFSLLVPPIEYNKVGPTTDFTRATVINFRNVFVANASTPVSVINSKLAQGLHLVLTPGNYQLTGSIVINNANTIVLGIGFPTLASFNGQPVITVGGVDGVRVAGVLLEGGPQPVSTLLQWGPEGGHGGDPSNPSFLYDIFARIGGSNNVNQYQVSCKQVVTINSGNVVYDNTWLWRADHDISGSVYNANNPSLNGLMVNGNNVTIYGLAVEHHLNDLVLWNGENGRTYFYQAELPYDVTQQQFGQPGYAGYRVSNNVQSHQAWGLGVYSFFRDHSVTTPAGIVSPASSQFVDPFAKWLNGNGQISHVWNQQGAAVNQNNNIEYVC